MISMYVELRSHPSLLWGRPRASGCRAAGRYGSSVGQKSVLGAIQTTDAPTNDPTRASAQERCP